MMTVLPALALLRALAPGAGAQPPADSVLAVLFPRDSATRLVLTADALHFGFTERGARRVRHTADSAAAASPPRGDRVWFDGAALARHIAGDVADGVTRGMRMRFPLASVRDVRAEGATLTVCFTPRALGELPCEKNRFVITGAGRDDARRFAAAVARVRETR